MLFTDFSTVEWLTAAAPQGPVGPELLSAAQDFQVLPVSQPSEPSIPESKYRSYLRHWVKLPASQAAAAAPSSRSGMQLPLPRAVRQPARRLPLRREPGPWVKQEGLRPGCACAVAFRALLPAPNLSATPTIRFSLRCPFVLSDGPTLGHVTKENRLSTRAAVVASDRRRLPGRAHQAPPGRV